MKLHRHPPERRFEREALDDPAGERPRIRQVDRDRGVIDHRPRPIEHVAMDRVRRHAERQLIRLAGEREAAVADTTGVRRHGEAAVLHPLRDARHHRTGQQLEAVDDQRRPPAAVVGVDLQDGVTGGQPVQWHGYWVRVRVKRSEERDGVGPRCPW